MVERYEFYYTNDFGYEYSAFRRESADGDYVLASDYAALEAERDALAKRINPDGGPVDVAALCVEIDQATDERDVAEAKITALLSICQEMYDSTEPPSDALMQRAKAIVEGK